MCTNRRETVTVTDMGGDTPKRMWGFTVSDAVVKRVVSYGAVATALLAAIALASTIHGFVRTTGEGEVRHIIAKELKPGGIIFDAQATAIEQHRRDAESTWARIQEARFNYLIRRLDQLQANQDHLMQGIGVEPLRVEPVVLPPGAKPKE
jgi:hypothetical protein